MMATVSQQDLSRRKAAVDGGHADPGQPGDVVELQRDAVVDELPAHLDNALPVAGSVLAQQRGGHAARITRYFIQMRQAEADELSVRDRRQPALSPSTLVGRMHGQAARDARLSTGVTKLNEAALRREMHGPHRRRPGAVPRIA